MHLSDLQVKQPWTVPYSGHFIAAAQAHLPHLYATHTVLHALKTLGKLAAVFEDLDHGGANTCVVQESKVIQAMAADLVTAAMRLANLYAFNLEDVLKERVKEKNGVSFE